LSVNGNFFFLRVFAPWWFHRMNTVLLSQQLARHLAVDDPALIPADAGLDVLTAINGGIATFYRLAPARYRQTTVSATLRAPETLSVTFAAKYSNTLTAATFDTAMLGCTLVLENGTRTVITGEAEVLDDWLSDTLTLNGTVYYDAVALEQVVQRIIGGVCLYDAAGNRRRTLWRDDLADDAGYGPSYFQRRHLSPGEPTCFSLDPVGATRGATPDYFLRVSPAPSVDYVLRFEAELGPKRITFAHLTRAIEVPVREDCVEDILLPLCAAELTASRFWADRESIRRTLDAAELVKATKLTRLVHDPAPSPARVGAPRGF
jgi:hypothetical protein